MSQLPLLEGLNLAGLELVARGTHGLPAYADLSPLVNLRRLRTFRLQGGSASVQREEVFRWGKEGGRGDRKGFGRCLFVLGSFGGAGGRESCLRWEFGSVVYK